jgi:hypothetical protein
VSIGTVLRAYATGASTLRSGSGHVIAKDAVAGTITVSTTAGGSAGDPTGWVSTDDLVIEGDRNAAFEGLLGYLPRSAPGGSDSFLGVNRSVLPVALAGVRYDGAGESPDSALVRAAIRVGKEGGRPTMAFCDFDSYANLIDSLGSKVQYVDVKSAAGIGFRAVEIHGGNGTIKVMPDRFCPGNTAFVLDMDSWKLRSLKEAPHLVADDGISALRLVDGDAAQVRVAWYAGLSCNAPGHNAIVSNFASL